jgi:LmbE family N-acetylglucosaminyl deacetylase
MNSGSFQKRPAVAGLRPPGITTRITARRALVLAPHYDDEVLGCGGLLAELASGGARVRVVFLSDGGRRPDGTSTERGGDGGEDDETGYSARRREESAAACRALGIDERAHLGLPDGALATYVEDLAVALGFEIGAFGPDLVLVPSPLEVTPDHRAAFAALHRVLGRLREGDDDPLAEAARELVILAYEVNHPAYPDVLVDVSDHLPAIEAAMAAYTSQQEIHDYLAAGIGLRRFRTLSLPGGEEGIAAAEGYRRLRPHDFATRSPADLIRHLGGVPELLEVTEGPTVSVVVRTRDRPALLAEALASLAEGTYRRVEVVLVNDGGAPPEVPHGYPFPVRRVDFEENRGRAAAAQAGVEAATGDWLAFLDDDDLALPEHLAVLASAATGAGVRAVYSDAAVVTYELAGGEDGEPEGPWGWTEAERRLPYSRDFDPDVLRLDNYIPFNTLLAERSLFHEIGFDAELPIFEDWDFLIRLARKTPFHHVRRVTCEYRHFRGAGHHALGERPRDRADFLAVKAKVLAKHASDLTPDALARAVDTLRAESVGQAEAARHARDEAAELRRAHDALADRYHRAHGEAAALREERGRLVAEVARSGEESRRLYQRERELAAHVEEQDAHLGRTYGEIERLNGIVETLRGATLPGIVRWWRENRSKGSHE